MKVAIHNSKYFSDKWVEYCRKENIPFKIVNCYRSDIIYQILDCDALMWDHHQANLKDVLFAKQLLFALEHSGKKVFPDFNTNWHFDDKIGQKYLFEAINAPFVPTYVFYSKNDALTWIEETSFPKVFKLRRGAGSAHVKLVRNKFIAKKIVKKAFNKGYSQFDRWGNLNERISKFRADQSNIISLLKGIGRLFFTTEFSKKYPREKDYVYFQDYIPFNDYDIRVIIIKERAFAIKRMVRKNDFRASGSGLIRYERENFSILTIKLAFSLSKKLNLQCVAFDFVYDMNKNPLVVEMSYGFSSAGYDPCPGYWDNELNWHEGNFNPYGWMVDNLLTACK